MNATNPPDEKLSMCPMVGWYDPRQLARTAIKVAVSTIFGSLLCCGGGCGSGLGLRLCLQSTKSFTIPVPSGPGR